MKTACNILAGLPLSISVLALSVAFYGTCVAAPDPLFGVPTVASARSAEAPTMAKSLVGGASSSAVPTSGAGAVPSASSALTSPSSALALPASSSSGSASTGVAPSSPAAIASSSATSPAAAASLTNILSSGSSGASALSKDDSKKDDAKSLNAIETRVSDSVKDVVKHLGSMTETTTLEDINVARQAVAKLEAMIDIERRLSELEKMRNERTRGSSSVAAAIPATALLPLPAPKPSKPSRLASSKSVISDDDKLPSFGPSSGGSHELSRVVGSNGHYRAVIKTGEGTEKTYRSGDKLSDGSVVLDITPTSVALKKNGSRETLRIKGVDMVFNGR